MSEYIRVLKRIRDAQRQTLTEVGPLEALNPAPRAAAQPRTPEPLVTQGTDRHAAAYGQLYDQIRLSAAAREKRTFLFAPVSGPEPVSDVTAGLAAYIEHLGYQVVRAELAVWDGRPVLRRRREASLESLSVLGLAFEGDLMRVDLSSATAQAELAEWIEAATRTADVLLIEGRPLGESIDAALVARACDGLILVVQPGVTERSALQTAADRARAAGCRTLGVVLHGSTHVLPDWMRRIVERPRPQHSDPEK